MMSTKNVLAVAILSFSFSLCGCSGDEVKPTETAEDSDVFQASQPRYTREQFREIFLKVLNAKNDKAAKSVGAMFQAMMAGIGKPGFSCRYSMESAQAYLSGTQAEFSNVTGVDGDTLKEAWEQLRAELGRTELNTLKSWMTSEAQKLIEPQLEMGFSGPEANNLARFVQACPDQFQTIIDELTNFLKSTNRWLKTFSTPAFTIP